jgi:hypothetical protein
MLGAIDGMYPADDVATGLDCWVAKNEIAT